MARIPGDMPATLIDLAGKAPLIATVRDATEHFAALKPEHREQARILLTKPVAREGQRTRTWVLEPTEIEALFIEFRNEQA